MIGRIWRARCAVDAADDYEALLRSRILPELDGVQGCRGAYVLRRETGGRVEFLVLHIFDSLSAVRSFAGEDYETAVVPESARELLESFDASADHYEIRAEPEG